MKLVFALSLCLFFVFGAFAQTETPAPGVEEITLFRSDGKGNIGEATEKFTTADRTIYCTINLATIESAVVKMNFVAVKAAGLKPETKIVVVSYTTNGNQNQVNFNASPNGVWTAGSYRVDIFINGKFAKSRAFEIEKSLEETGKKQSPVKSFAPRAPIKRKAKNHHD